MSQRRSASIASLDYYRSPDTGDTCLQVCYIFIFLRFQHCRHIYHKGWIQAVALALLQWIIKFFGLDFSIFQYYYNLFQISAREELQDSTDAQRDNNRHTQQSKKLPYWLWFIIAKSLGIKLHAEDRPIAATVLYTITFTTALGKVL